jgi:hypothetical protein
MSALYGVNLRLLAAFRHLMVPLVRILVRNGIPYREFAEVVKEIYARVGADETSTPTRPASLARVAIITGLNRRELQRIFGESDKLQKALESNANAIARLLQGWHTDPAFTGPYGFPRDLPFGNDTGAALTFVELARRYASEIPPEVMLDELLRVNAAVQLPESGLIRVVKRTYIPEEMAPELIEVFARGVRRYIETIDHNLREKDPRSRRFERWVFPDFGIREEDWDAFTSLVNDRLIGVIEDLDNRFAAFDRPGEGADEGLTVGVGMYVYRDEDEDERLFRLELKQLEPND